MKETFLSFFNKYKDKKLVLTTHRHPDCDGTSAIFALSTVLPNSIIAFQTKPEGDLLPLVDKLGFDYVLLKDLNKDDYDGLVVADCHTYLLLSDAKDWPIRIILDHHHDESKTMHGEFEIIKPDYRSTAEIVHDLLPEINKEAAIALAVGIIFDTARFKAAHGSSFERFSNLMKISEVPYEELYKLSSPKKSNSKRKVVLETLQNMEIVEYGGYVIVLSEGESGASTSSSILSDVADFVFISTQASHETRTSVRGGTFTNIPLNLVMGEVGKQLGGGGGGHAKASGASTQADVKTTQKVCLEVLKKYIDKESSS